MAKKVRGAVMIEAALSLVVNLAFLLGALEIGYYLDCRQALVGAAREASRGGFASVAEQTVQNYLVGQGFSDDFINSVLVEWALVNQPGGVKIRRVTLTTPISQLLIFGGDATGLFQALGGGSSFIVRGYDRDNKLTGN